MLYEVITLNLHTGNRIEGSNPSLSASRDAARTGDPELGEVAERLKEHAWKVCIR